MVCYFRSFEVEVVNKNQPFITSSNLLIFSHFEL